MLAKVDASRRASIARQVQTPLAATVRVPLVQLPLWPQTVRGVPNAVLRSALFGAIRRGRRLFHQRVPLAAVEGVTILFTGPRLDQADLDVWEQCLHLTRHQGLGGRIQFAAHGFLREIGRSVGGKDREWLKGAFARLTSSVVEVKDGNRAYFGSMIQRGARDDTTGGYVIEINSTIVALYGSDGWSQVEWAQRQRLKRQPLAQWLHGFYTTHAAPYAYKVETLHRLAGSENAQLAGFRRELREALAKLSAATDWGCEIDANDLVHIRKIPSAAQSRHLAREVRRRKARDSTHRATG